MKNALGIIAILLAFIGYIPYIRDIIKQKTQPHAYSWFVWTFITFTIFALQAKNGAGIGSYITLAVSLAGLTVFVLGLKYGKQDITWFDTSFFVAALGATAIWLLTHAAVLSVSILVAIDMLGFMPTVRKSWNKPHTETLALYQIGTLRHLLSIFALSHYNYVTVLFPATWSAANLCFVFMLVLRRKAIK